MKARRCVVPSILGLFVGSVAARPQDVVIYETESQYNRIYVTEDERGYRSLLFEEGGALQSTVKVGDPEHLELPYARSMNIGLAFAEETPKRALIIGLGGGSIPMFLHKHYPKMQIDVVDIDPEVVAVAKQLFGFQEDELLKAHIDDGREFIEKSKKPYDLILLDAYGRESIPRSLATREFFQAVRRAVTPRGIVVGNIWSRDSNPLYGSLVRTYQDVFEELYIFDVRASGNKIFVALPCRYKVRSAELARRAGEISKEKGFRFDLGDAVEYGYQYATERVVSDPVLTDERDAPRIIRPRSSAMRLRRPDAAALDHAFAAAPLSSEPAASFSGPRNARQNTPRTRRTPMAGHSQIHRHLRD